MVVISSQDNVGGLIASKTLTLRISFWESIVLFIIWSVLSNIVSLKRKSLFGQSLSNLCYIERQKQNWIAVNPAIAWFDRHLPSKLPSDSVAQIPMQFTNLFLEKVKVDSTAFLSSVVARKEPKVFVACGKFCFAHYEH